jgi:hypothetical protein
MPLRRYVTTHGEPPVVKPRTEDLPRSWTIRQLFGSRNGYLKTAGFAPRPYRASNPRRLCLRNTDGPNYMKAGRRTEPEIAACAIGSARQLRYWRPSWGSLVNRAPDSSRPAS